MARSPSLAVSEGHIKNGTEVYVDQEFNMYQGKVVGYIASTHAYLIDLGSKLQAFPAPSVMRLVPKFNTIEEVEAWLEQK